MSDNDANKVLTSPKLKLEDFESSVQLRTLTSEDLPALLELQNACFPGMEPWSEPEFLSQLKHFPEGQFGIEVEGQIVATCSSLIVDFSEYSDWHSWETIADDGFIRNHDPEGDTLYGIEIMVHPEFRGMKLSRRLYAARKELCRKLNLMRIIVGGRIPGYGAHADEMTASEYLEHVVARDLFDPVLTPQLANGFVLRGLIPNYLEEDVDSRGFATHLEWLNLDYHASVEKRLTTVSKVRLSVVQWQMRPLNSFADFEAQVKFFVDTASEYRSDFVVFPELFTLELLSLIEPSTPNMAARQLSEFTPQYLELMADLALRYHINIVGGSQLVLEGDSLYNIAYLFRRDGSIEKQYKIHVTPNERKWWGIQPGQRVEVFDTDCGTVAINICYDVEFPELARYAAARNARILFVPFNTDERNGYHRVRSCAKARAIENHMFVAISGCVGNLPLVQNTDIHYAQSAIFTPSDIAFSREGIAAEASENISQLLIHDVDTELVRRHRVNGTTKNWHDRRTDLYQVVFNHPEGEEGI